MSYKIAGRVIAVSDIKTVASSDPSKQPMKKRELYMDCTRFDGITGQQIGYENKVLLEFGGDKVLDKFVQANLQKGDIINVDFDLQGNQYTDKTTGKMRVFTAIRCFDFSIIRRAGEQMTFQPAPQQTAAPQAQPAPAPQPAPTPAPQPQAAPAPAIDPVTGETPKSDGLPF